MAKVLSSISRDSPATPQTLSVGNTFTFAGTPGFTGSSGVQRYDFKWEVNPGSGYVTLSAATGLSAGATNPIVNTNSQTQQSITVTCSTAGSYTIRMTGAPVSGGSYTVLSATQTVTVSAPQLVTPGVVSLTTATFAPTVTAPRLVTPPALSLTSATFAPTAQLGIKVIPTTASLATTLYEPTAAKTDNKTATPDVAALATAGFAPTVTTPTLVTVPVATTTTMTFAPTVTATASVSVTVGSIALSMTGYAPAANITSSGQYAAPDADLATTGWGVVPLWSKINDNPNSPNGVVITSS